MYIIEEFKSRGRFDHRNVHVFDLISIKYVDV